MAAEVNLTDSVSYNITLYQGRTLDKTIICDVYSGGTLVGQFDFAPYSGAVLEVKIKPTDTYNILKFDTTDDSIVLGEGEFTLSKSATEMNIKAGTYYYDMYLINGDIKRAFISGVCYITQKVSE